MREAGQQLTGLPHLIVNIYENEKVVFPFNPAAAVCVC